MQKRTPKYRELMVSEGRGMGKIGFLEWEDTA